ncbi:MAG: methyltransferase domain-containing protein [Hyphomonadaceae bacterium]|nr:methyltransferase domain-containing protein [Hyphomonadaceae bacterium]
MRVDVLALQRFYASRLGEAARAAASRRLETLWPSGVGLDILGVGYAGPLLAPWRGVARRTVSFMPEAQGAERWPADAAAAVVLGDELRLPFADAVFDRAVLVHALEEATAPRQFLREVWRVMAPEGRLVVIVANRAGLWALGDGTPFGSGRPYSRRQLGRLLGEAMFEPTASAVALHALPWEWASGLADGLESAGRMLRSPFGGIVMMEAVKRLYAAGAKEGREILLAKGPVHAAPHLRKPGASD